MKTKNISKINKYPRKKIIVSVIFGCSVLIGLVAFADAKNLIDIPFFNDKPSQNMPKDSVNYDPPTKEEVDETQKFKENLTKDGTTNVSQDPPKQANGKKVIVPVLSSWGFDTPFLQASGFVPNVIEQGGVCTLTATKDGASVTATIDGTPNAQNVSCGLMNINRDKLTAGTWKMILSYSSNNYEGVSTSQTQEVE